MKIKDINLTTYNRFGLECVKDPVRNILIQNTPEEYVRQCVVNALMDTYGYPLSTLETEYLIKSSKTRADVVVWLPTNEIDSDGKRLEKAYIVIECKNKDVNLTEEHFLQGVSYSNELNTDYLVITNGLVSWIYQYNEKEDIYEEIEDIPSYTEALDEKWAPRKLDELPEFKRPTIEQLADLNWLKDEFSDLIFGLDTPGKFWKLTVDLQHLLWSPKPFFKKVENVLGYQFCEDLGVSLHTFGNASGGKYFGKYRSFLVRDYAGNDHVVRLSIFANMKTKNDPRYGNSRGKAMFNIAICNGEKMHNSLQLSIDDFVEVHDKTFEFWHDGRMTVGNIGRRKNKEVLDFISVKKPELLSGSKIRLGEIPRENCLLQWNDVKKTIFNLIIYGLLRDDLRNIIQG